MSAFSQLGLSTAIDKKARSLNWTEPTPIQTQAIPLILKGQDLMAIAQTGSGKTGAFLLPILDRLPDCSHFKGPAALVLAPTRELALQIDQNVKTFAPALSLSGALLIGGLSVLNQKEALATLPDIVVATPGRLLDHVRQKNIDLSDIRYLVLDEADRMLDMGFLPDIKKILSLCPPNRQSLLFSATLSDEIHLLAQTFLIRPALVEINANRDAEGIEQKLYRVPESEKPVFLRDLIVDNHLEQVLVFTRQKRSAALLADSLKKDGFSVEALHGDKTQAARLRILEAFKNRSLRVLVATDLASRGLDIKALPAVVNYELPQDPHDYIHRIGRTARAGAKGVAYSLVSEKDAYKLDAIEKLLKKKLPFEIPTPYEEYFVARTQKGIKKSEGTRAGKNTAKPKSNPGKEKNKREKGSESSQESFDYIFPGF